MHLPITRRALIAAPFAAYAQEVTFTTGVRVVNVLASVRDKKGAIIADLTKDDFEVYDDGRAQPITVFANDIQPISIVVMLDTISFTFSSRKSA